MKKKLLVILAALLFTSVPFQNSIASTISVAQDTQQTDVKQEVTKTTTPTGVEKSTAQKVLDTIMGIVILGAFLGGLAYMIIILRKKYYIEVSAEQIKDQRLTQGLSPAASDNENSKAAELLETALAQWSSFKAEDGETYFIPRKMAQVKRSVNHINEAKSYLPTDNVVINRMNELGGIVNERTKRSFAGSWSLLAVSLLVMVFFYFIGSGNGGFFHKILKLWWLWGSMIFYILASYAPQFLIEKRMEWFGGKKFSSGLIKTVLAIVVATPVSYTVVKKWSDGTTTKSEEGTGGFIFIVALAAFALLVIGICIIFFGIINFIRNYLLFF